MFVFLNNPDLLLARYPMQVFGGQGGREEGGKKGRKEREGGRMGEGKEKAKMKKGISD